MHQYEESSSQSPSENLQVSPLKLQLLDNRDDLPLPLPVPDPFYCNLRKHYCKHGSPNHPACETSWSHRAPLLVESVHAYLLFVTGYRWWLELSLLSDLSIWWGGRGGFIIHNLTLIHYLIIKGKSRPSPTSVWSDLASFSLLLWVWSSSRLLIHSPYVRLVLFWSSKRVLRTHSLVLQSLSLDHS